MSSTISKGSGAAHVGAAPADRKADILRIASGLFAARGFEAVSFRDLTEATEAKRPLLLYHFGSKEALWQASMREIMLRFNAAIASGDLPGGEAEDAAKVAAYLRTYIDALVLVPEYGQVLIREGVYGGPRLDWLVRHFVPAFVFDIRLSDSSITRRLNGTMLRDLVIGAPLFAVALGPLIEASTAAASSQASAGIYPLSDQRRDELVGLIARMVLSP